jgi:CRP/FNR family cyclic AMP-dependent transcriptional regulator
LGVESGGCYLEAIAKYSNDQTFLTCVEGRTTGRYSPGKAIFRQGEAADAVFYVGKGKLKLTVVSDGGKEAVVAILNRGDFIGTDCLSGQSLRMATATSLTDCVIVRIEKEATAKAIRSDLEFSGALMSYLLTRNMRMQEDLADQLCNSTEKRLARMLLLLTGAAQGEKAELSQNISQETLAGMIGTTRSRVSHFMNKFRRLGLIEYGDGLIVHSSLLNVVLND